MAKTKGQASAEFIVVIIALFTILFTSFAVSQIFFNTTDSLKDKMATERASDTLAAAIAETYTAGDGASTSVYLLGPQGANVSIEGNSVIVYTNVSISIVPIPTSNINLINASTNAQISLTNNNGSITINASG